MSEGRVFILLKQNIKAFFHFQNEEIERIIHLSLTELKEAINSGKLKPSQVLTAYQAKVIDSATNMS